MTYKPSRGLFAGQVFASERQYRNALARRKGYSSWSAWKRAPRSIRRLRDLGALSPAEYEARQSALQAVNLMREEDLSLSGAARKARTTPGTVLRYTSPAIERRGHRYRARTGDRLLRVMQVLGRDGIEHEVTTRGSRSASLVGEHWSAIGHYLRTCDDSRLRRLEGRSVAGIELETDPTTIDLWERRGELEIEDIYELVA